MNKKMKKSFKKKLRRKGFKEIIKRDAFNDILFSCFIQGIKINPINIKRAASMNYNKYCKSYKGVILHLDRVTHFAGIENLDKCYNYNGFTEDRSGPFKGAYEYTGTRRPIFEYLFGSKFVDEKKLILDTEGICIHRH